MQTWNTIRLDYLAINIYIFICRSHVHIENYMHIKHFIYTKHIYHWREHWPFYDPRTTHLCYHRQRDCSPRHVSPWWKRFVQRNPQLTMRSVSFFFHFGHAFAKFQGRVYIIATVLPKGMTRWQTDRKVTGCLGSRLRNAAAIRFSCRMYTVLYCSSALPYQLISEEQVSLGLLVNQLGVWSGKAGMSPGALASFALHYLHRWAVLNSQP